jgi:ABC-type phosphate/phosphonate transport system substrate-binding protein
MIFWFYLGGAVFYWSIFVNQVDTKIKNRKQLRDALSAFEVDDIADLEE